MKVLMLARLEDKAGGGASYSRWLIEALKKQGVEVKATGSFWKAILSRDKIIHIQHEPLYYGLVKSVLFPFLIPILRWRGKKVIITLHGVFTANTLDYYTKERFSHVQWLAKKIVNFIFSLSCKYADILIVHQASFKKDLLGQYPIQDDKVRVIHHGIIEHERKMVPHPIKTVSMFGFFGEHQYNHVLIAASKYLPNIRFNITNEWIEDIGAFLSETDLFVFPETNRVSTSGVLFLAIGYGLPCIAYDDPAFRDLGVDLFGTLDPLELSKIIDKTINDDVILEELSEKSKRIAKENSWMNIAKQTVKIYESFID